MLRAAQADRLQAEWFERVEDVPDDVPLIVVANEFFDALPVRQCLAPGSERGVTVAGTGFSPAALASDLNEPGEVCEAGAVVAAHLGGRLRRQGGAVLVADYGYAGALARDSLQALHSHAAADPFADPGDNDLTAHVDFSALARAAGDVLVSGPVAQGVWLTRLGIEARARQLQTGAGSAATAQVAAALVRLTAPAQMGNLFKVMAMTGRDWPVPAGFDA